MSVDELPPLKAGDLARLRAAMKMPVDTSDMPELRLGSARVQRDQNGKLPVPMKSAIRDAILAELGRRQLTRYQLWKRARTHCATLPESAVYEFLRGARQIGLQYIEALMAALDLTVQHHRPKRRAARAS